MSCENSEMSFITLNDHVLLNIFKFLNWIDSISLGATCTRMKNLKYWKLKKNQEFDLTEYVKKATVPIEKVLPAIGPYIRVAKITEHEINKSFMKKCYNIRSLKIDEVSSRSAAITLNTWMKELKIESLNIDHGVFEIEEILDGIEGLKTFIFEGHVKWPSDFFYKNSTIQRLLLNLNSDYNLSSPVVLPSLQSLFLYTERTAQLDDVQKYIKLDNLKEFSINFLEDDWDADIWDNFAKYLAKNTKLDNLKLNGYGCIVDEETLSTLKLFNLTSLWLDLAFSWKDFSTVFHEAPATPLKYLKLQWPLTWCCSEKIGYLIKIWTNVEAICLDDGSNPQLHFKNAFFTDILNISDNRPELTLHIFSSKICFNFISKRYNCIEERKSCSCVNSFQFWDGVNCNFS